MRGKRRRNRYVHRGTTLKWKETEKSKSTKKTGPKVQMKGDCWGWENGTSEVEATVAGKKQENKGARTRAVARGGNLTAKGSWEVAKT